MKEKMQTNEEDTKIEKKEKKEKKEIQSTEKVLDSAIDKIHDVLELLDESLEDMLIAEVKDKGEKFLEDHKARYFDFFIDEHYDTRVLDICSDYVGLDYSDALDSYDSTKNLIEEYQAKKDNNLDGYMKNNIEKLVKDIEDKETRKMMVDNLFKLYNNGVIAFNDLED